ncbi:hypothetical protein DFH06DRAFT_1475274 [Mycena polygramma]|nr:hypothetical protein DFH06DRAFT_1475274 [Mycena polygramma]
MATLSQELIYTIVHEVDDKNSLEACSLVSPAFRGPSQRILLHTLTLGDDDGKPYTVALAFLYESPHVAQYFTRLACILPATNAPPAEIKAFARILPILSNVRHCYFLGDGRHRLRQPWRTIPRGVRLAMEAVFQRRSLHFLYMGVIGALPAAILEKCFGAASTLFLSATTVEGTISEPVPSTVPPVVQNLFLIGSPGMANVLLGGQFDSQLANVRRLWWNPVEDDGERPVSDVASKIEHVRIEYEPYYNSDPAQFLVPAISFDDEEIAPFLDDTSSTLDRVSSVATAAGQTLKEIFLKCSPRGLAVERMLVPMKKLAIRCRACARDRWRVDIGRHEHFTFTPLCECFCGNPTKTASYCSSSALSARRGSTPPL